MRTLVGVQDGVHGVARSRYLGASVAARWIMLCCVLGALAGCDDQHAHSADEAMDAGMGGDVTADRASREACAAHCAWRDDIPLDSDGDEDPAPMDVSDLPRRSGCLHPDGMSPSLGVGRFETVDELVAIADPTDVAEGRSHRIKYFVEESDPADPWTYFALERSVIHSDMMFEVGCDTDVSRLPKGDLIIALPGPRVGFTLEPAFEGIVTYERVERLARAITDALPALTGPISFVPFDETQEAEIAADARFADAPFDVTPVEDVSAREFFAMNPGLGVGRLRHMAPGETPNPTDIVVYDAIPNTLPRVAGVISTYRQTQLAHINLRAIQDDVPNISLLDDEAHAELATLEGEYVRLEVNTGGYEITPTTWAETTAFHEARRPVETVVPALDLSVREIQPLDALGFEDAAAFGTKAANVAEMLRVPDLDAAIPRGYAVPISFYFEFMVHNGLDRDVDTLLDAADDGASSAELRGMLAELRDAIRAGTMPPTLHAALGEVQQAFPQGQSIRCRSSTNNEDLPGFSGAGLYASYTHHEHEGHLAEKSILQVYESLWTDRAFEQRRFYRVDQRRVGMGVLLHPNYSDELRNGVAVAGNPFYMGRTPQHVYYVNTQVGEDMVTNPDATSIPEELIVAPSDPLHYLVLRRSTLAPSDDPLLTDADLARLRDALTQLQDHFAALYQYPPSVEFLVEIEFKITAEGSFAIKQARPWVWSEPFPDLWTGRVCDTLCGAP